MTISIIIHIEITFVSVNIINYCALNISTYSFSFRKWNSLRILQNSVSDHFRISMFDTFQLTIFYKLTALLSKISLSY